MTTWDIQLDCYQFLNNTPFPFCFEGGIWDLIISGTWSLPIILLSGPINNISVISSQRVNRS